MTTRQLDPLSLRRLAARYVWWKGADEAMRTPGRDIAYLCGNPDMVDQTYAALKEFGLPVPQIRREKHISSR